MSPDDKRHGTYAGAVAHWRDGEPCCPRCLIVARRARKQRDMDRTNGNPRLVPLGEDAWRILTTVPHHVTRRQTGIRTPKLISYAAGGPDKTVNRLTRDRILAVQGWTTVGVTRRLRALTRAGWSMRALSIELGVPVDSLVRVRLGGCDFVKHHVGQMVVDNYDRLCMVAPTGPGATRARNQGESQGWPGPLAWDDIDTDPAPQGTNVCSEEGCGGTIYALGRCLPHYRGKGGSVRPTGYSQQTVDRILGGDWHTPASPAERVEVCRRWAAHGHSLRQLGQLTGWRIERYFKLKDAAA